MAHNSIYTVNGRLAQLENAVTELRKENAELRVHLAGALQTAVNDAKNSFRNGRDGAPGRDGESIVGPKGDKGERGDVLYIGPPEVETAVKEVRAELLRLRAAMLGRIVQGIKDNEGTTGGQRLVRMHLQKMLGDIEKL